MSRTHQLWRASVRYRASYHRVKWRQRKVAILKSTEDQNNTEEKRETTFLSVKWKILFFSAFLLALLIGAFCYGASLLLKQAMHAELQEDAVQFERSFVALTQSAGERWVQTLQTLPNLSSLTRGKTVKAAQVEKALAPTWDRFQSNKVITSMHFYFAPSKMQVNFGEGALNLDYAELAFGTSKPVVRLDCLMQCMQTVAVPVPLPNEQFGVLAVRFDFQPSLAQIAEVARADVALTSGIAEPTEDAAGVALNSEYDLLLVAQWGHRIHAVSAENVLSFLPELDEMIPWKKVKEGDLLRVGNMDYYIKSIPWQEGVTQPESIVLIKEAKDAVLRYYQAMRNVAVWAIWGWVSLSMFLVLMMWSPLKRIAKITNLLPLFASSRLDEVQGLLVRLQRKSGLYDETDALIQSAVDMAHHFESMRVALAEQESQLEEKGRELHQEKDFVSCLLDTAHAIILTQDSHCQICLVNRYGLSLLGKTEREVQRRSFLSLLPYDARLPDLRFQLDELSKGVRNTLSHESEFIRFDGKSVFMVWYHSRIPQRDEYGYHILSVALDISQRKRAEEHLGWLASHDSLTGLINRRRFTEEVDEILVAAERYGGRGALLYLDLDQFKDVNDTSGHHTGDDLLKRVARILRKTTEDGDLCARLGGDEFAMLLVEADEVKAVETAENICRLMTKAHVAGQDRVHRISASVGIALFPDHGDNTKALIANADLAMYQAKESGRNGWSLFQDDGESWSKVRERVYWNELVKNTLEHESFKMYFQPIMNLQTMHVSHYEALIRIFEHDNRMVSPQKFILSAEQSGVIQELDQKIIAKVFKIKSELQKKGIPAKFSINLSGLSFRNENLFRDIETLCKKFDIQTREIIFEITETAAVLDSARTKDIMEEIRELGCCFSLDDFGVGFSSLYYLKQFPFDYVKIDGSFVRNLKEDMDDQVMVRALVEVAQSFGQYTVAEFVENQDTLNLLKKIGVDFAQGYHVGKPASPADVWPTLASDQDHLPPPDANAS